MRARFGYVENGPLVNGIYPCAARQMDCTTSGTPFVWSDETQSPQSCSGACTINIPAISGRVLYYLVERQIGGTWTPGGMQMVAVP